MKNHFFLVLGILSWLFFSLPVRADEEQIRTITNPLGLDFPWDMVSFDFPGGTFPDDLKVTLLNQDRPAQVERLEQNGKKIDRVWFFATMSKKNASLEVRFSPGRQSSSLKLSREPGYYLVNNGISTIKISDYRDQDLRGRKLQDIPHWLGGVRVGDGPWDGRAWFEGVSVVRSASTTIIHQGPVFVDIKIEYTFEESQSDGTVLAQPPELGKQTFRRPPGDLPREMIPKRSHHYEVLIRVAMNDPWTEVVERYRLPRLASMNDFGVHQYFIHFGTPSNETPTGGIDGKQHFGIDTVMWTRWFEWDSFGGNSQLQFVDAQPRPAQKGRPFAILRSRWNQGGGGAQDFFLTSGGKEGNPQSPAAGIVAAYPSKWVGPYAATLFAYVYDGNRGQVRLPLTDGSGSDPDSHQDPQWYGNRSYALCVGPRELFDSTAKLDSLVRRHTDWTLNAQVNKYILEWPRDSSVAGANILTSQKRLEEIRREWKQKANTSRISLIQSVQQSFEADQKKIGLMNPDSKEAKDLSRKLNSNPDYRLLAFLEGRSFSRPALPNPDQYLSRRYQADDVNPTNYGTRRLINNLFPEADLYSIGKPFGDARTAAIGYICTDLDAWPGYRNGWGPGNPNFHTDKYIGAIFAAAAMKDHPHSREWFEYGKQQFEDDVKRVITAPDGVGYECPGYSGYSLGLQTELAAVFYNAGVGNLIADNPLVKASTVWHRKLLTPFDRRLNRRHEAPHGDTHRWDSGIGIDNWAKLAMFYREADPKHASELMGVFRMLSGESWKPKSLRSAIFEMDLDFPATPPDKMDWSSQYFHGFGTIFRNHFGTERESFLSMKSGWTRGHYHNDELAFHYYNHNTPIALDYNCSYHPRGDHAALHNSMTFGKEGKVRHNGRGTDVNAAEQMFGSGRVGAFISTPQADLVVAERSSDSLTLSPVDPHDAEFSRNYESRRVDPIVHRRWLVMIRHHADSPLSNYLIVRDETQSREPQQINLHLLARDAIIDSETVRLTGQWDQDMIVRVVESTDLNIEKRYWAYFDEWTAFPEQIAARPDETDAQWADRVQKQLSGWKPSTIQREQIAENSRKWQEAIDRTEGRAMMPPPGWDQPWLFGEAQIWLRMSTYPGTPTTWILYPYKRGTPQPVITRSNDGRVSVKIGDTVETIEIGSEVGMSIERNGVKTTLLTPDRLPGMGQIPEDAPVVNETRFSRN